MMKLTQKEIMAVELAGHRSKTKLVISILSEIPKGLDEVKKAFEVRPDGQLLRILLSDGKTHIEIFPVAADENMRSALSESFGFKPVDLRKVPVPPTEAYLRTNQYFVPK